MPSPLANTTYRRLFTVQVIALAGIGLSTVASALLVYNLAGGNAGVVPGTALAIKMRSGHGAVFGNVQTLKSINTVFGTLALYSAAKREPSITS